MAKTARTPSDGEVTSAISMQNQGHESGVMNQAGLPFALGMPDEYRRCGALGDVEASANRCRSRI